MPKKTRILIRIAPPYPTVCCSLLYIGNHGKIDSLPLFVKCYQEKPGERTQLLNVISLEFSKTKMEPLVQVYSWSCAVPCSAVINRSTSFEGLVKSSFPSQSKADQHFLTRPRIADCTLLPLRPLHWCAKWIGWSRSGRATSRTTTPTPPTTSKP